MKERDTISNEVHTAVRHSAVYGLGGVLAKAMGFFMLPFYTHYLNPSDYGVLEILDLSMSLFGMFLNMGITAALLRSYTAATSPHEKRSAVSTAFLFVVVTGVSTFALGVGFVRPLSTMIFGADVPSKYLLLSFSSFVLGYLANLPRTYLRAMEASGSFVVVETIGLFLMLTLNVYFIAVLKIGLAGILWSSLIVNGLQAVTLSVWMVRKVGIQFSGTLLRSMVSFGLPLVFSNLAMFALNFSDRFFLQRLRSVDDVGLYAVGYKFAFMISYLLVQPFYAMWQSRMYTIHTQPNHREIFRQIFTLYSLLLVYAGLALSVFSPEIVHVMVGPQFASTYKIIPIIALAYVFYGVGYYVQLGMFLTNKTHLIGVVSSVAAVLNLILNYVLVVHYGTLGAAWATLLSFLLIGAGSYWVSLKVFPLSFGMGRMLAALAIAVGMFLISRWWTPQPIAVALLVKIGFLAAFPVVLWKSGALSPSDICTLSSVKNTVMARVSGLVESWSEKAA